MDRSSHLGKRFPTPPKNRVVIPLCEERKPTVETAAAAYYLNRKEQTLRYWACSERGPIRPLRINGRLHWAVSEIKDLLGVRSNG
jgi:hypothetical protein